MAPWRNGHRIGLLTRPPFIRSAGSSPAGVASSWDTVLIFHVKPMPEIVLITQYENNRAGDKTPGGLLSVPAQISNVA